MADVIHWFIPFFSPLSLYNFQFVENNRFVQIGITSIGLDWIELHWIMVAWSICRAFQSRFKLSTAWLFHFQLCCNNKQLVETAEFGNFDCELINLVILVVLCARWWQHSMQCVQSMVLHSCTQNLLNWIMDVFDVIRHFDVLRHWFPFFFLRNTHRRDKHAHNGFVSFVIVGLSTLSLDSNSMLAYEH